MCSGGPQRKKNVDFLLKRAKIFFFTTLNKELNTQHFNKGFNI